MSEDSETGAFRAKTAEQIENLKARVTDGEARHKTLEARIWGIILAGFVGAVSAAVSMMKDLIK